MRKGNNIGPPPSSLNASTFDWEGRQRAYYDRLDKQIAASEALGVPFSEWDKDMIWRKKQKEEGLTAAREMAAKKPPPTPKVRKPKPPRKPGSHGGNSQRFDRDEMVRLYVEENLTTGMISEKLGCGPQTVVNGLRSRGVYNPGRDVGRSNERFDLKANGIVNYKRPTCAKKLHDMEKYGRVIWRTVDGGRVPNGRYCLACLGIRRGTDPTKFDTVPQEGE